MVRHYRLEKVNGSEGQFASVEIADFELKKLVIEVELTFLIEELVEHENATTC